MAAACEPMLKPQTPTLLEQLFWAHHERVLRAAYRVTGNMADAEDVAQTVFIRLAGAKEEITNPESYLYRAAINGALDVIRKRKGEVELDVALDIASSSPHLSPERQMSSRELRQWLRRELGKLNAAQAELFVLRYIEERDNAEIAKMCGTSRASVAVRLHQIRAKLKKQFQRFMRGEL